MDPLYAEAIESLRAAAEALLAPLPGPAPGLVVHPLRVAPACVGAYVGEQAEPRGSLLGRRIDAALRVTVRGADAAGLGERTAAVTGAFLGASRGDLLRSGILRLRQGEPAQPSAAGDSVEQVLTFELLYEFVRHPAETEHPIRAIPRDVDIRRTGGPAARLSVPFLAGVLDRFEVVDDPAATTDAPSAWTFNAAERRLEQRSRIRGAQGTATPNKPGTYLVLRADPNRPVPADVTVRATFQSGGGGVGLVFRWQDAENFCFCYFHTDATRSFRLLGKKAGGAFQALETPALDGTQGYEAGRPYAVRVAAEGPLFRVYLDGEEALVGRDASVAGGGRIGFLCRDAGEADFYSVRWESV